MSFFVDRFHMWISEGLSLRADTLMITWSSSSARKRDVNCSVSWMHSHPPCSKSSAPSLSSTSMIKIFLSVLATMSFLPSEVNAKSLTRPVLHMRRSSLSPSTSTMYTTLSRPPDTNRFPSGNHAHADTLLVWTKKSRNTAPLVVSHIRTEFPEPHERSFLSSGDHAKKDIERESSRCRECFILAELPSTSQMKRFPSRDADANSSPLFENFTYHTSSL
mmetsp:Transcript_3829/g.10559  ORF Transcript_3829/g.10559 Transcript_3829/m.10559 type:complete len:219 (-) Transcript_3829:104-760(-)